ncbi:hypothetical protein LTR85_005831 [Meristemomyces frigidus]|nr:hypothetical protein LTR85_005831 [Meristemomyces frigidus]
MPGRMPEFFGTATFQTVLQNPTIAHQLLKFAQSRLCGENLEFLARVTKYYALLGEVSKAIYEIHRDFISTSAQTQINLPEQVLVRTSNDMKASLGSTLPALESIFGDAQTDIENLVYTDIYPHFVRHQMSVSAARALGSDRAKYAGLGDCFVLTDPSLADNPIVYASDGFVKVTGYNRNEIIPRNCRFLQCRDTDRSAVRRLKDAIDKRQESVELLLNQTKNGEPFWNLLYTTPLYDAYGKLAFFLGGQINCSTTIHKASDVLRILGASKEGENDSAHAAGALSPQQQPLLVKPPRSRNILNAFRSNVSIRSSVQPRPPGMENGLLDRIEDKPFKDQMDTFYTAYSNYLIINASSLLIAFVSAGLVDLLFPIKAKTAYHAQAVGADVFKFLANHGSGSVSWDYKSAVKGAIKMGQPISLELKLCARPYMGFEMFVLHWTPLKDEQGGLAGCVVAGRLAEADPKLSILVIEQGPNSYEAPEVVQPALYPRNLFPTSKYTLFWQGNQAAQLAGRKPIVPSGGTLGGGSAINWMVYTRAQRSDFDSWGAKGWSADELYPFLRKFETYHGQGEREHHGFSGPINISKGTHTCTRAENDFIDVANQLGYTELRDLQNLDANNGTERWMKYIGPDGRRQDSAHRFLHPKLRSGGEYPNLHVLCEKQVIKVLFDGKFQPNPEFMTAKQTPRTVRARKMVVLSAGANGTPLILERSGVGNPEILGRAGVPVVEGLPGVGHDYQDHHLTLYAYRTCLAPGDTINGFADGRFDAQEAIKAGHKLLGTNAMDASGKFRPTEEDVAALGPEFKAAWEKDFKNAVDRPLMIIAMYLSYFGDHSMLPDDAEYVSMANWTAYPYSRGHIHITGPSVGEPVDFDVGYLKDANEIDVMKHICAYKLQREMWRRMGIFRGELASSHPRFPAGSKAAVIEKADGPVAEGAKRLEYSQEDGKAIEQKIREIVTTTWHSLGTCKMAPREKKGVVDPSLSVHGLEGLKVADLSVPPENVGANTGNTAFVIGEKAADIFIRELGLGESRARL